MPADLYVTHFNFQQVRAGHWSVSGMGWKLSEHTGWRFALLRLQKSVYCEERVSTSMRMRVCLASMRACALACVYCKRNWPCASCPPVATMEISKRCTKPLLSPTRSLPEHMCDHTPGCRDTEGAEPKKGQRHHPLILLCFGIVYSVCSFCLTLWLIETMILCWLSLMCD